MRITCTPYPTPMKTRAFARIDFNVGSFKKSLESPITQKFHPSIRIAELVTRSRHYLVFRHSASNMHMCVQWKVIPRGGHALTKSPLYFPVSSLSIDILASFLLLFLNRLICLCRLTSCRYLLTNTSSGFSSKPKR